MNREIDVIKAVDEAMSAHGYITSDGHWCYQIRAKGFPNSENAFHPEWVFAEHTKHRRIVSPELMRQLIEADLQGKHGVTAPNVKDN